MPTISVKRDDLFQALGKSFTEEEFRTLCFDYGIELDDVTTEHVLVKTGEGEESRTVEEVHYKIDIPANRYDLLCLEGLARSLRIFLGTETTPEFRTVVPQTPEKMIIEQSVLEVRPFVVCAILRGVSFSQTSYDSFIALQDKLHHNICRRRTLVSIGTHDLDTIKGPFLYQARKPEDIRFVPLNDTRALNGQELMADLENGHLREFLPIIKDKPRYPVIYDSNGIVLSLPPIINGDHSKITLNTKNVFIEVTATDLTKATVVLNIMVTMFSEYCQDKFTVESVETVDSNGRTVLYPDLSSREEVTSMEYINSCIGINLGVNDVVELLKKMALQTKAVNDGKDISVLVPPTRSDILHACDIMEDVAIAYGYNNLKLTVPSTYTVGKQQPINKFTDLLRNEVAQAGYTEMFTLSLCTAKENFEALRRKDDGSAVKLANPATQEFQVGRVNLLAGGLKTLSSNSAQPLPVRVFEVSDVMLQDPSSDVGAVNRRRLCALYSNTSSGFEVIHGLVDRVMLSLGIPFDKTSGYTITPSDDEAFFPGRRADILWKGSKVGVFGIVHPEVLGNFELKHPVSAVELDLQPFLERKLELVGHKQEKEKEN